MRIPILMEELNRFLSGVIVRDGWRAQAATTAEHHQICLAHLQRRLNYLNQKYITALWEVTFSELLESALLLKKRDHLLETYKNDRIAIIKKLEKLLEPPPDNNASERDVRNIKVKQKISGQFKGSKSAQNFAQIRSVIDTIIKNRMNVLESLISIAHLTS